MEMVYDYFPETNLSKNPTLFPAGHPEYQPENLEFNKSKFVDRVFIKLGLKKE